MQEDIELSFFFFLDKWPELVKNNLTLRYTVFSLATVNGIQLCYNVRCIILL